MPWPPAGSESGHYSFGIPYLILPVWLALYFLPDTYRLWLAAAACALPAIFLPVVFLKTSGSRYPLHEAAEWGEIKKVKRLLAKKAEVNARNDSGYTPLHMAARSGSPEIVTLLL